MYNVIDFNFFIVQGFFVSILSENPLKLSIYFKFTEEAS